MFIERQDLLLEDRLAPITTSMGLFEAECSDVVRYFLEWQEEIKRTSPFIKRITSRAVTGSLESVLRTLLPLQIVGHNRCLFIPTQSGHTAYFDNGYRGTDPTVIAYLPRRMGTRSIWLVANPHEKNSFVQQRSGWLILEVYGPEETEWLNLIRRIRLEHDLGRWNFEQFGKPFSFEDTERYQAKKKTDRFDYQLLQKYLHALGDLLPFDENFYLPANNQTAVLVEFITRRVPEKNDVSLEEARRRNSIE